MYIQTLGNGPDLLLIHGWAMHGGIFHPLAERLADHHRVHVVDLPGHGRSRVDSAAFELTAIVERLTQALPPAVWIGWSLGGLLAIHAAIHAPQSVHGLVSIAGSPRFVVGERWKTGVELAIFEQFGADLRADYRSTLERFLALEMHGDENALAGLRGLRTQLFDRGEPALSALAAGLRLLEHSDLRDQLAQIACPSVWIGGRRDRLVPSAALAWSASAAGGRCCLIDKAGHAPFLTHIDQVQQAIIGLLGEVTPA